MMGSKWWWCGGGGCLQVGALHDSTTCVGAALHDSTICVGVHV